MSLSPDEFIGRFLLHSLPVGFHRIRHYASSPMGVAGRGSRRSGSFCPRPRRQRPNPPPASPLMSGFHALTPPSALAAAAQHITLF